MSDDKLRAADNLWRAAHAAMRDISFEMARDLAAQNHCAGANHFISHARVRNLGEALEEYRRETP